MGEGVVTGASEIRSVVADPGCESGARVVLTVADDGVGAPSAASLREGVGLGAARARLEQLYGGEASLAHGPRPGGGFEVLLRLPVQLAATLDEGLDREDLE